MLYKLYMRVLKKVKRISGGQEVYELAMTEGQAR